jgi:dihydrolipoamide dehydrogenase
MQFLYEEFGWADHLILASFNQSFREGEYAMAIKILVIGAGPGGYVAAVRAAQLGGEVTLIEKENVGGTCLNWGCIPSKIMKASAELLEKIHQAGEFGISVTGAARPDMARLMARKAAVINAQIQGIEMLLKHHKIRLMKGEGTINGPGAATVKSTAGEDVALTFDRLILAMGSTPTNIPSFPFDGERILSSNEALGLTEIPESILIVGGGVIGCEFACILATLGSRVTVVEALDRLLPLPSVDAECSKVLQREMKKRQIDIHVNRTVVEVTRTDTGTSVTIGPSPFASNLREKDKQPIVVTADKVLVSIGRSPATTGVGLSTIGVALTEKGWIRADDHMRTRAAGVYAIGDVLGPEKVMLAHAASAEAQVAAENAMGGDRTMDYRVIPSAIFTIPEVATVGLSEAQAAEMGIAARADTVLYRSMGKAQVINELAGHAKIISEKGSGKILGVHLIGAHATDLIAEGALATQNGLTVNQIAGTIHAHPTLAEIMAETAFKASDRALHG